ncbi:putative RNase H [Trypanosoma cruzi]|uniref:Putative RNase H n=1 Tax=Trypanosoma cruzi TaxID=5693 RepID=A0A2V2WFX6_TRYCR|nr:putative RNase H [Trypanosoma cruzi]
MRCRRRTQLWHALSAEFRALSTRNPRYWRLICRRSMSFACARLSIFENTRACQTDWMRRPPPEPPPRAGFRISPLSRDELYAFVDAYTKDYGITESSPREERFFRSSIPPWFAASAHRATIGVELPIDHSITDEEELIRENRRVSEEALALHSHRS